MSDLQEKREQFDKLRRELQALEDQERMEKILPELLKLKGTIWKERNCYDRERPWWVYTRVVDVTPECIVVVDQFQTDSDGRLNIVLGKKVLWRPESLWPCDTEGWDQAVGAIVRVVEGLKRA